MVTQVGVASQGGRDSLAIVVLLDGVVIQGFRVGLVTPDIVALEFLAIRDIPESQVGLGIVDTQAYPVGLVILV